MTLGLLCLLLIAFAGAGNLRAQEARGGITGTVVSATKGEAVQGAVVTARLQGPDGSSSKTATSGPEGYFGFGGLPAGRYELRARKSGYGGIPGRAPRVNLSGNEQSEGLVLRLWPSGVIAGRVLDPDGEVVAESQVRAYGVRYGPQGVYWSLAGTGCERRLGGVPLVRLERGEIRAASLASGGGAGGAVLCEHDGDFLPSCHSAFAGAPGRGAVGSRLGGS